MFRWAPYTFVRILLFFIAGITTGIFYPDVVSLNSVWVTITVLTFFYGLLFVLWHFVLVNRINPGTVGLLAIFLSGYWLAVNHKASRDPHHLSNASDTIRYYKAVVTGYPQEKQKSWKLEARVMKAFAKEWSDVDGDIILYLSKPDFPQPFEYGDVLLIKGSPQPVQGPSNPGEFDYRKYLGFRNIYHQHFIRGSDVKKLGEEPPSSIVAMSMRARMWADGQLKKRVEGQREQGIASALVLGITDGIDNELLGAYSATGAMHVLAVSGLHISIIYLLIGWIFKPILKYKAGPWILAIVSLFLLWGYAFITGLSPSVLRAVTMFSFVAIARPARQFTNIYNILAVSAFCLLVYDPFLVMSVGFQLSYVAVLGIIYLQPGLYQLWSSKNYLLDQTWNVTTVALAAQLATLPLGLLYFHQFPNYFLITNMLVVPISFVVLLAGIAVILFGFVPALISVLGWILTWSIKLMNGVIFVTEGLPFAITDNVHITLFQCWMLIGIIVCMTMLLERKNFSWMVCACIFVIAFSVAGWNHRFREVKPPRLVVYNIDGVRAIDLMADGKAMFVSDSIADDKISFHIKPCRLNFGIRQIHTSAEAGKEFPWGTVVEWGDRLLVNVRKKDIERIKNFHADYLIISHDAVPSLAGLSFRSKPAGIILDATNSYFYSTRILTEAATLGLEVHSVKHHGAYQKLINPTNI